jgi:hypothetical protein
LIFSGPAALLLMALAAPPEAGQGSDASPGQVTFRRQIVIRSVRVSPAGARGRRFIEWRERRGPRCVPARAIAGAARMRRDSVDLILRNRSRIRVRLGSACPALDYYQGFYLTPGDDGLVCSERESLRSRVGGQCEIEAFSLLYPVNRRPQAEVQPVGRREARQLP